MQENKREQKHARHHRKSTHVIRIRTRDKPLVLRVLQRPHRNLCRAVQVRVPHSVVINFELVHAVHVWDFKPGFVHSVGFAFKRRAHKGIDTHEFQLDVASIERLPGVFVEDFYLDRVHDVIHDRVGCGWAGFAFFVVFDGTHSQFAVFFEYPLTYGDCYVLIAGFYGLYVCISVFNC